jgi:AraC family transcriptional regulator, activator of mtrCDE
MITLERLLDGLHVEVEPCPPPPSPAHVRWTATESLRGRSAVMELVGGTTVRFSAHRVIIMPPRSRPRSAADDRAPGPGSGDTDVVVGCGRIRAVYQESLGLFDHLREPLVETLAADDPIRQSFEQLVDEIASHRPGFRAMAETLVRRCLILLLRRCFEHGAGRLSWLAIEDTRLGRAVTAMQDRPEHSFTLTELAEVAGMSRSVFAARFAGAAGQSPMEFLKALRLRRAAEFLTRTDLPVKSVSARVGYSSRSAFTRAFVARHGLGPTAFRAAARDGAAQVA